MKRIHLHIAVERLDDSIRFYSAVLGTEPSVRKADYARWVLEDPRVHLAISQRGGAGGLSHLGIQVETADELTELRDRLADADPGLVEQAGTVCCYSLSDKSWVTDPSGIAWEAFHSLGAEPTYDDVATPGACCTPGCCTEPAPLRDESHATGNETTRCCQDSPGGEVPFS